MAALSVPFTAHSQYYDYWYDEDETIDNTNDSLRNISMNYYKDLNHWTIFIEPSVTMTEDTAFDQAGLKHTYFVRRFYFFAVPEKADFKYQPKVLGPYLYAYGQKMPAEGKDAQHFQMIRKAVFPFASDFSASTPSNTIFQQYVENNFDKDYHYVIDSLMAWCINNLKKYDFQDTTAQKSEIDIEEDHPNKKSATTLSCLGDEYANAIPRPTIIEAPAREPIASAKSIEQMKKVAVKTQGNIYVLPQNTILNQIAQELDEDFKYNYGDNGYTSSIAEMTIRKNKATKSEEDEEYEEYVYLEYDDYFSPVSVSGQSYIMLNDHALLLYPETYCRSDDDYDYAYLNESREMYYSYAYREPDTVLIISPNQIEKMTLADCYQSCLKDTSCTFDPEFPPFLNVFIDDDLYDEDEYYDCKECYKKEAILEHLKEGSVMYEYFAKDFYLNDLPYKNSKSVGYYPSSSEYWVNDVYASETDTIYFTKKQNQAITKLLHKRNNLNTQTYKIKMQAIAIVLKNQVPEGQLHLRKTYWGDWLLEGESKQKEETNYDDDLVIVSVDEAAEAIPKTKKQKAEKWEQKIDKLEAKFYKILEKIDEIDNKIDKIAGHNIILDEDY